MEVQTLSIMNGPAAARRGTKSLHSFPPLSSPFLLNPGPLHGILLHRESFPVGRRAALRRIAHRPTSEVVSDEFPFLLVTGRTLYHFNAGTMTLRTANVQLRRYDLLEISPEDAEQVALRNGDPATVRSRYGQATLVAHVNPDVRAGELFCTFHDPRVFLNEVTSPLRDGLVDTPEYKVTAVQVSAR